MNTAQADVEIANSMGIHLRPASSLVQTCNQYPNCEVEITKDGQAVNGKSIMSVIMLAAEQGSVITIKVTGEDSEKLLADLVALVESKFGED
jgi:phosphocarrier protein HPr